MLSLRTLVETIPILREHHDRGGRPKQEWSSVAARFRAPRDLVEYDQISSCEVAAATAFGIAQLAQLECICLLATHCFRDMLTPANFDRCLGVV